MGNCPLNWKARWKDEEGNILFGAIDDCIYDGRKFIIIDFKTYGGSEIKDEKIEFYQNQLNCYALLFEKNGLKHPRYAYLIFFLPVEVKENGKIKFDIQVKKVSVDSRRALNNFKSAVKIAKGKRPARNPECKFCEWERISGSLNNTANCLYQVQTFINIYEDNFI